MLLPTTTIIPATLSVISNHREESCSAREHQLCQAPAEKGNNPLICSRFPPILTHPVAALRSILSLTLAVLALFSAGCRTKTITDPIVGPDYLVSNVFRKGETLPGQV